MKLKQATRIGLIIGVVNAMLIVVRFYASRGQIITIIDGSLWLILIAGMYMAINRTREVEHDGVIGLRAGMKAGVNAGAVAALIMCIVHFFTLTHTDIREVIAEAKINHVDDAGMRELLRNYNNGNFVKYEFISFALYIIVTFFISFAAAVFLKSGRK